jgi:hypothetical protein
MSDKKPLERKASVANNAQAAVGNQPGFPAVTNGVGFGKVAGVPGDAKPPGAA